MGDVSTQRELIRIVLGVLAPDGFVLAGSNAIREHGLIDRLNPPNQEVSIDLGMDWRGSKPALLDVGPVLALRDAIGNKAAALYSRGEPRDFLDGDSIRQSGKITDAELEGAAAEADIGFDRYMFTLRLETAARMTFRDVGPYGVTNTELSQIQSRFLAWAQRIREELEMTSPHSGND